MRRSREALVLLPGFLCDRAVWQQQIDSLSDIADCTCADYGMLDSLPAMAESVLRTAPGQFSVAGHSMGGRIAFEVFRLAPERVRRIAIFNSGTVSRAPGAAGEEEERGRRRLLGLARSAGMRAMALDWIKGMVAPARLTDTPLVESIVQMFERKTPDLFEAQMKALLTRPDATPVLSQIRCPALFLSGREDGWSTPATHERLASAVPGSRLVVVPDSGHMSTLEQPAAVAQAMRDWLLEGGGQSPARR
ncbi:MAG TPA: alpha/beta hydrolase [Bryobacteraceae bacterium]|jgi:pimeloyl-ACP methyl ester carboxylesterase